LAVAIQGGFTEACEVLLGVNGADPNYSGLRTPPPLVLAAAHNHAEILIRLLQHGHIDINQTDGSGRTALAQACCSGSDQCLKELLRDGRSKINSCDSDGRNALIHACMTNHVLAAQQLLREPLLDVHLCDKYGRNAMSYAAEKATLPVVRRLFHLQVSIAQKDANGRNAISWVANSSRATKDLDQYGRCVLEYLVEKYPDGVDSLDKDGWSPLAWAMERPGYLEAVRILVEKGKADINQRDQTSGRSVLAWAASEGFAQIVEYLLSIPHLDKNATDDDGRSPLSYAAANGMIQTLELLLRDSEVTKDLRDSKGRTPTDWARMNHHDAIVSLLSEHGFASNPSEL
jgi:ankyrin repeat protein